MRASRGMGDINPAKKKAGKMEPNDEAAFAKGGKNWIAGAIKHPGALHKALGVPQGEKIPASKLSKAAGKSGTVGKQARLAQTLKGFHK